MAPVLVSHFQLQQQRNLLSIMLVEALKADDAAIPTVAKVSTEGIRASMELIGHVVSLILHAVRIAGPSWGQNSVADALAVERQLVQPVARDVDSRIRHGTAQAKFAP